MKSLLRRCLPLPLLLSFSLASAPALAIDKVPSFAAVKAAYVSSDAVLLDRRGQPLADRRFDPQVRRLGWVELQALPEAMREALLTAEDKRFFEHGGVDWMAFAGAVWQNLWGTRRGASTLTMQLAGLLDPALALPKQGRERRSLTQKWDQGLAAIELERRWSKPQILEAYLNLAPFRGDLQGLGAASEVLFGMPTAQLGRAEAAILAALLRGPNAKPNLVAQRACVLSAKLGGQKLCPEIQRLAQARLDAPRGPRFALAPHLAQRMLSERGQRVATLLDARLQQALVDALRASAQPEAAAILLDNSDGSVLAWVGGTASGGADGVLTSRNLSGWWWPHLATLALDQGVLSAPSLLPSANGRTLVGIEQRSLRSTLNSRFEPGLHALGANLSPLVAAERLQALGLAPPPSVLLPGAQGDVSLAQLAAAWRSLASGGHYVAPRLREEDNGFRSVAGGGGAFVTLDMLSSQGPAGWQSDWISEGQDGQVAVVGCNAAYTLAVVTRGPRNSRQLTRQLWRSTLDAVAPGVAPAPSAPFDVESAVVVFEPPVEPARREWLLRGHALDAGFRRVSGP